METLERWRYRPDYRIGASHSAKGASNSQRAGIRYHQRFYRDLRAFLAGSDWEVFIEPWFQRAGSSMGDNKMRQPDAVLIDKETRLGLVIEAKLNWKLGRDEKLINEYLPITKSAFGLDVVTPLVVTSNVQGYPHPILLGIEQIESAITWFPGDPTPMLLHI